VKKVEEYLAHASECRALGRAAPAAHREQLEDMAKTWEQLAEARKRALKKRLQAKTRYGGIISGVLPPPAEDR